MSTNHIPMIPEDMPWYKRIFEKYCYSWFNRKLVHPILEFFINLYYKARLQWICPIVALVIMLLITMYVGMESWWTKQIFISKVNIVKVAKAAELPEAPKVEPKEMTTEQYILYKFGKNGRTALAVAKAESGLRCDAQNVNKNGSVDAGLWQINSIHLKKGWKLTDLLDCKKATDFAYELYKAQGFNPWVAYWSGSYKKFLK